jgi:FKBP-type peptidyl-prolyl cis-trans isomerase/chromosome segregation ATPase
MKARELELQIKAARRELACVRGNYCGLGLQVSRLCSERTNALQKLVRTQQYLQSVQPGHAPLQSDTSPIQNAAAGTGRTRGPYRRDSVASTPRRADIDRKRRWRKVVARIKTNAMPVVRLRQELESLQRQLSGARTEYNQLEQRAEWLARERDLALADLERARACVASQPAVMRPAAEPMETMAPVDAQDVEATAGALRSAEEKLHRVQVAKNDGDIALAERDDRIAVLQSERDRLTREIEQLAARLTNLQQDLQAAQAANQTLVPELNSLRDELRRTGNRDAEQIAVLQQRIVELEPELTRARETSQALEEELQAAAARHADAGRQRQQLEEALESECNSSAALDRQLGEMWAQDETRRSEIDSLKHQLAGAMQQVEAITGEFRSAEEKLHRVQVAKNDGDIALAERDDRIAVLQSERGGLTREIEQLTALRVALQQELAMAQAANQALVSELGALRDELTRTGSRDAEQIAVLQQRIAELEPELTRARDTHGALEEELEATAARHADAERQRQQLEEALESECNSSAALDRQLGEMWAQDETRRSEIDSLKHQLAGAMQQVEAITGELRSAEVKLHRAQVAKNDGDIALAERDDRIAVLQSERDRLTREIERLTNRFSSLQQELEAAQAANQTLVPELNSLREELRRTGSRDAEQIAVLQQRIAELEPELERARDTSRALESELQAAAARHADTEQQRQQLEEALKVHQRQFAEETKELKRNVSVAEQSRVEAQDEAQALRWTLDELVDEMQTLKDELVKAESLLADAEQRRLALSDELGEERSKAAAREHRLTVLEPELVAAHQQVEELQRSLSDAACRQEVAERNIEKLGAQLKAVGAARQSDVPTPSPAPAAPIKRHRRGWTGAAAGFVLVLAVLAGAAALREFYWQDGPLARRDSDPERELPRQLIASRKPVADSGTLEYKRAPDPASQVTGGEESGDETKPRQTSVAKSPAAATARVPGAATKKPKQAVSFASRSSRTPGQIGTGAQVQAYLMQEADSDTGGKGLCDGDAEGKGACTETERRFMKDTVVELPSGAKYKVINNGSGRSPQSGDSVLVSYSGMLPDGTEFDSASTGSESEAFRLSQAIRGLQDVLPYMEEGAKWEIYLPTELAFPEPGPLGGQEVILTVELLAVLDSQAPPAAAEQANDEAAVPTRELSREESYRQTAGDGETSEPQAEQASESAAGDAPPVWRPGRAETEAFLSENSRQEGVVSLPSGLQYRVLKSGHGSGRSPNATDTVVLKYRGTLPDGREFDRSDGQAEFSVQEVIPGWQEALLQMQEGAEWELYIPPTLAHHGATRNRGALGQQPLIYQVELVEIK